MANVTVPQDFPALVFPTGLPLTASTLLRALRLVSYATFKTDKNVTLHSMRRGAAQACQNGGLSLEHIMSAGMWRSSAVNSCIQAINISSAPADDDASIYYNRVGHVRLAKHQLSNCYIYTFTRFSLMGHMATAPYL